MEIVMTSMYFTHSNYYVRIGVSNELESDFKCLSSLYLLVQWVHYTCG